MRLQSVFNLAGAVTFFCCSNVGTAQTTHEKSGIILPSEIDNMEIVKRGKGGFGDYGQAYDYNNDVDRIEVKVFKATYPNPSVWFPFAQDHLTKLLKPGGPQKFDDPSIVTVGSTTPNAIRQTYQFSKHYQSSALAIIGFGDWMAFIMSTSKSLSPAEQNARMDDILSKISVKQPSNYANPITLIDNCKYPAPIVSHTVGSTELISPLGFEMVISGGLAAQYANIDASGDGKEGLTKAPQNYCREFSPTRKTSWFRSKDDDLLQIWITPVSVTGLSIQGMMVPAPTEDNSERLVGALIANNFERSSVVGFTRDRPHPIYTQIIAMSGLFEPPKIASVAHKSSSVELVTQDEPR